MYLCRLTLTHSLTAGSRLTLTSGAPVTSSDVTGATTIYYTSFTDSRIALYDGVSSWNVYSLPKDTIGANCSATSLILQDGIYIKSGATTKRYLGTFYTTTATTTEDSKLRRFVWNAQNRVSRILYRTDSTGTWNYSSATWRSANNNPPTRYR